MVGSTASSISSIAIYLSWDNGGGTTRKNIVIVIEILLPVSGKYAQTIFDVRENHRFVKPACRVVRVFIKLQFLQHRFQVAVIFCRGRAHHDEYKSSCVFCDCKFIRMLTSDFWVWDYSDVLLVGNCAIVKGVIFIYGLILSEAIGIFVGRCYDARQMRLGVVFQFGRLDKVLGLF